MIWSSESQKKAKRKQLLYLLATIGVIVAISICAIVIISYTQSEDPGNEYNYEFKEIPCVSDVEEKLTDTKPKPKGEPKVKPKTDGKTEPSDYTDSIPSDQKQEKPIKKETDRTTKPPVEKDSPPVTIKIDPSETLPQKQKGKEKQKVEDDKTPKPSPRKQEPTVLGDASNPTPPVQKDKPIITADDKKGKAPLQNERPGPSVNREQPIIELQDNKETTTVKAEAPKVPEDPKKSKRSVREETPTVAAEPPRTVKSTAQKDTPEIPVQETRGVKPVPKKETKITPEDNKPKMQNPTKPTASTSEESGNGSSSKTQRNVTEVTPKVEVGSRGERFPQRESTIPKETPRAAARSVRKKPKVVYKRKHKYVMVHDDPDYTPDMSKVLQASKTNWDYDQMEKNKMPYETIYDLSLDKYIFTKTFGNSVKDEDDLSMHPLDMDHPNLRDEKKKLVIKEIGLSNSSYYYEPSSKNRRLTSISYDGNKLIDYTGLNKFVGVMVELIRGLKVISVIGTDEEDERVGLKFKIDPSRPGEPEIVNNYVHLLTDILRTTHKGNFKINA